MVRAVTAHSFGEPESFVLEEMAQVSLKPNEVRISIKAAGVSFVDVLMAQGKYQLQPPLPYIPGTEFSGIVSETGSEVKTLVVGDKIFGGGMGGGHAEECILPEQMAKKMPDAMTFEEGAVFRVSYVTIYHALVQRGNLQAGETVLVLGAGGAIGIAAIQMAKAMGARVIASASTQAKRNLALQCGADHAIDTGADDWRDQIKALTDKKGVDVVVDPVGGSLTEKAFRSLAWKGRHLVIGFAEGTIPALPINLALLKGAALVGVDIRQFGIFEPDVSEKNLEEVFKLYNKGKLKPPITKTYALENFVEAMNTVFKGEVAGRVVITMGN